MSLSPETLTAVSLVLAAGAFISLYLSRTAATAARSDCRERIQQLESLNASMAQRIMRLAEIIGQENPTRADELKELADGMFKIFREYQSGSISLTAEGDVNIGGDVSGRDKIQK